MSIQRTDEKIESLVHGMLDNADIATLREAYAESLRASYVGDDVSFQEDWVLVNGEPVFRYSGTVEERDMFGQKLINYDGQTCKMLRPLHLYEYLREDFGTMFEVKFSNGIRFFVFEFELENV